jgi:hypothetical protein
MTALHDTLTEREIADRNLALIQRHVQLLLDDPARMGEIPEDATLFFIPDDDPILAGYNLARARQLASEGRDVHLVYFTGAGTVSAPIPVRQG